MSKIIKSLIVSGVVLVVGAQSFVNYNTYSRVKALETSSAQVNGILPQIVEAVNVIIQVLSTPRGNERGAM